MFTVGRESKCGEGVRMLTDGSGKAITFSTRKAAEERATAEARKDHRGRKWFVNAPVFSAKVADAPVTTESLVETPEAFGVAALLSDNMVLTPTRESADVEG